jgi:hypothetical protein
MSGEVPTGGASAGASTNDAAVLPTSPRDADAVRPVTVGTVLWIIAGLVLLTRTSQLRDQGHLWWLGACAAGSILGLIGIFVVRRRRSAYRRAGRDAG